jgi:hypothetical protein
MNHTTTQSETSQSASTSDFNPFLALSSCRSISSGFSAKAVSRYAESH